MTCFTTLGMILLGCASCAAEPAGAKPTDEAVHVVCHGRLLQGVVAIGGDTTGTTVSFDGMTWDLKLNDQLRQQLAGNELRQVTVTGQLRRVQAVERPYCVVDVEKLIERDPKAPKPKAEVTVTGTLALPASNTLPKSISVAGESWPIVWGTDSKLQAQAVALAGKTVVVHGTAEANTEGGSKKFPIFHIEQLQAK